MQYVGLVSVIVAVTNLIPNFGPIIGGVIGAFVLLLVNPLHALLFIAFCIVLQFCVCYILKPSFLRLPRCIGLSDPYRRHCAGEPLRRARYAALHPRRRDFEFSLP